MRGGRYKTEVRLQSGPFIQTTRYGRASGERPRKSGSTISFPVKSCTRIVTRRAGRVRRAACGLIYLVREPAPARAARCLYSGRDARIRLIYCVFDSHPIYRNTINNIIRERNENCLSASIFDETRPRRGDVSSDKSFYAASRRGEFRVVRLNLLN
ncbi:hypothetical protein EVAR_22130_1 [Eumeta japonica]|uniref:Uncharacterized protein n=1 Tax=Eumeta variegata TaxID=151549 RepID=A0A4C1VY91_EUMVA|nr:hypothetical protein EVAR_22130_1 [Eumeta japonica]